MRTPRYSLCHPDRPYWAKGYCCSCYKRIKAKQTRISIKADPIKYAEYLAKIKPWNANARARRTPEQKECVRLRNLKWRQENRERDKLNKINHRKNLRCAVIKAYGNKCACCGEDRIEFLAIDHIHGGGNKHRESFGKWGRKGYHFYYWLKRNKWPIGYRVLCHNCNQSLGHYGYCPHTTSPEIRSLSK